MEGLELIADLYRAHARQGPGGPEQTDLALALTGLDHTTPLQVADIGSGTGASALHLARRLNANVTAVDFLPEFLQELETAAGKAGLSQRIQTLAGNMEQLPFDEDSLDLSWSEGAIYNLGFSRGVNEWRDYLRPGGVLAVSEITWLTEQRPEAVGRFWEQAYPEIDTAANKLRVLEEAGYSPLGYFVLPESSWLDNFYTPLEASFEVFLARHGHSASAEALVEEHRREITLYRKYRDYYSYGFYVAKRVD